MRAVFVLLYAIGVFFAGALALLPSPNHKLWYVALASSIYGYLFALLLLPILFYGRVRSSGLGKTSFALVLGGIALAMVPTVTTYSYVRHHKIELPLSTSESIFGISKKNAPTTVVFDKTHDLKMDLYFPKDRSNISTVILVVHGGSWHGGERDQLDSLNYFLASRGKLVASIDYRLTPRWIFPAALEDVEKAIAYLTQRKPRHLFILGRSAGGHLALLSAYRSKTPVSGVIAMYAPTDMHWSYNNPADPDVLDGCAVLREFLGGTPKEKTTLYNDASPIKWILPQSPPTLLVHGMKDEMVSPEQSERLAAELARHNVPHQAVYVPWANHGFDFNFGGPQAQLATAEILKFLDKYSR